MSLIMEDKCVWPLISNSRQSLKLKPRLIPLLELGLRGMTENIMC